MKQNPKKTLWVGKNSNGGDIVRNSRPMEFYSCGSFYKRMDNPTVEQVFEMCNLVDHRGYESYHYHPDPGGSDYAWWRYDANNGFPQGIELFDQYGWTPLPECGGYTVEEQEIIASQIVQALPINNLEVDNDVRDRLPGVVQDILSARFRCIEDAKDDWEPSE